MHTDDAIIATKVNDGLKFCATTFAKSATEASTPQVRQALTQACQASIQRQGELARIMEQKGWYSPPAARSEDIQQVLPQLQQMTGNQAMTGARS